MAAAALPPLTSLHECADYSLTVAPFHPQLAELRARVWADGLLAAYTATNPLISAFGFSLFAALVFFVVSSATGNYSQVDRMWAVLPTLYVTHLAVWARLAGAAHDRVDLVAACVIVWTCRLTFNYWRRGGYKVGSEDYRWAIVRTTIPPAAFVLLNATFISLIQSVLLFLISAPPAYAILLANQLDSGSSPLDWTCGVIVLGLVASEWVSDGQQWAYHCAKNQYQLDARVRPGGGFSRPDLDRGFLASGLWAYSRHPNFVAEQAVWLVLYQWGCAASEVWYGWIGVGALSLVGLFQASTRLTERISASKYREYGDYQAAVAMFVPTSLAPWRPGRDGPTSRKQTKEM